MKAGAVKRKIHANTGIFEKQDSSIPNNVQAPTNTAELSGRQIKIRLKVPDKPAEHLSQFTFPS